MRPTKNVVGWLLSGVLLCSGTGCADGLILHPTRQPIEVREARRREVRGPAGTIDVWTIPAKDRTEPGAFVLEFPANMGRAEHIVEWLSRFRPFGAEAWAMNYPGYGKSDGSAKLTAVGPAALAVFDELKRVAGDRPIYLVGNSFGTVAALHVAARRNVAGLVLTNPPPLRALIMGSYGWWNLWLAAGPVSMQVPRELDSLANAAQVNAPAVFILADHDEVVPPPYQRRVAEAYAGDKRLIWLPGARHGSSPEGQAIQQVDDAMQWLRNHPQR